MGIIDLEELAVAIVSKIHADLNNRRGFHLSTLDDELLAKIEHTHNRIVMEEVNQWQLTNA